MKKFLFLFSLLLLLLGFPSHLLAAQDCTAAYQCESKKDNETEYTSCLTQERTCWENNVKEAQSQAGTLKSAISILDGQIKVQSLKIQQTTAQINQLEEDINDLGQRIEGLASSLDHFSGVLINRIVENYKQSRSSYRADLFQSDSFNDYISKERYLTEAQNQTLDLLKKTETQRLDYDQQKTLKEKKQTELESKQKELQSQKAELDSQKKAKDQLLAETKNSEAVYQQKLAQLNAQLASFSSFASSVGTSLLSDQTRCDGWGCYYSQRDSQWGLMHLGNSSYTIASSGCLVTSVAMISTHYGKSLTPAQIASSSAFAGGDLSYTINVNGVTVSRNPVCSSSSCLDSELANGKPVIVRLRAANSAGTHFIVILEKKDGQYIMHDPVIDHGNYKNFSDHYSLASISRVDRVAVY
jgi:peptidoglycan hydrolase CwlO-like protein